jgi:hypothetical protein
MDAARPPVRKWQSPVGIGMDETRTVSLVRPARMLA